ncbi:MAG: sensor histidine kinase [Acidimicrobiales bacterium]
MQQGGEPTVDGGPAKRNGHDVSAIELFLVLDRLGAVGGALLVIVVNGLIVQNNRIWLILPFIAVLIAALTVAKSMLDEGGLLGPLLLAAGGNWLVAVAVSVVLPFLWPVMAITVLMPMVLAAPFLDRSWLLGLILSGAFVAAIVGASGLLNDDGGAIPDIEDEAELVVVMGALAAQIAPIGLIAWQTNRLQQQSLKQATSLNVDLRRSQDNLAASRRRVVEAADTERRRIERDLHDGAQQRLVALGVRLRLLERQTGESPELQGAVQTMVGELDEAIEEVRELAHGIYPPLLQSRGLQPALTAVARRSPSPVTVTIDEVGRLDQSVETALYFTALEALTNAAKHAPGAAIELTMGQRGETLELTVVDDGPGFVVDDEIRSQGTHNMGDRLAAIGGELTITSSVGGGTTVLATTPIER